MKAFKVKAIYLSSKMLLKFEKLMEPEVVSP